MPSSSPPAPSAPAIERRGLMLVLSSPSAAGKSSIARRLLAEDPEIQLSVSVTTRPPRAGERDGHDYHFVDQARFDALVAEGALLEHARVFRNHYGTPAKAVEDMVVAGKDVLFDIDWQGAQQLSARAREDLALVFVLPPSLPELARRLAARASEPADVIAHRMSKASDEMSHWPEYDYVIVNHNLDESVARVQAILTAERLKRDRQSGLIDFVNTMRHGAEQAAQETRSSVATG